MSKCHFCGREITEDNYIYSCSDCGEWICIGCEHENKCEARWDYLMSEEEKDYRNDPEF